MNNNTASDLLILVARYNTLLHRFAMRLTRGNFELSEKIVQDAMEEAWEENKFYDTPQLRSLLQIKVVAKALSLTSTPVTQNR